MCLCRDVVHSFLYLYVERDTVQLQYMSVHACVYIFFPCVYVVDRHCITSICVYTCIDFFFLSAFI